MPQPLNMQSGMPQMNAVFNGWTIPIAFDIITQSIVNGFTVDTPSSITVDGVWQPLSPEQIALKPDGQRSWEWIQLHVRGKKLVFATADLVTRNGIQYKVMAVKDYTLNNYSEYHLIRNYQGAF